MDVIEEELDSKLGKLDNSEENNFQASEQTAEMGFETSNPLSNMLGTAPLIIGILGVILLIALIMRLFCFSSAKMKAGVIKIKKIVMWNAFIRYWLEEYLTICISSLIKLYALDFTNWYEASLSSSALFGIAAVTATPFVIWTFLYKKYDMVSTP